jgi:integrase/recombinase XerC
MRHRGYRLRARYGKTIAEVYVGGGRYRQQTFPGNREGRREAEDWAQDEAARIRAGVAARARFPAATGLLVADHVAELRALGRSEKHCAEVQRYGELLAAAVPDLGARGAEVEVGRFLAAPPRGDGSAAALSPATRNKWLVTIRGICRWAILHDRLAIDPTRLLRLAQRDQPLPATFSIDELRRLLAHTHWDTPRPDSPAHDPYHALFAVLIYTGFRFQEAARLHWEDVDWTGQSVLVRLRAGAVVKRRKERIVPLQPELAEILRPWRHDTGRIFVGREHNPYRGFAAFLDRAGVAVDDRSPHACRHTWASLMAASGVTSDLLRAYLGHGSATTTAIYTQTATRYVGGVREWPRGELRLLTGWASAWAATGRPGRSPSGWPSGR